MISFVAGTAELRGAAPVDFCVHRGLAMIDVMGWLAENREQLKAEIKNLRTWDRKPSLWRTVLHEFRITVRPTDAAAIESAETVHVSIEQIEGDDADSYDCPRAEILS
jgi:hypothetical protein